MLFSTKMRFSKLVTLKLAKVYLAHIMKGDSDYE